MSDEDRGAVKSADEAFDELDEENAKLRQAIRTISRETHESRIRRFCYSVLQEVGALPDSRPS